MYKHIIQFSRDLSFGEPHISNIIQNCHRDATKLSTDPSLLERCLLRQQSRAPISKIFKKFTLRVCRLTAPPFSNVTLRMERYFEIRDAPLEILCVLGICRSCGKSYLRRRSDRFRRWSLTICPEAPGGGWVRGKLVISSHTYLARHKRTHVARVYANFDVRGVKNNGCGISLHSGKGRVGFRTVAISICRFTQ